LARFNNNRRDKPQSITVSVIAHSSRINSFKMDDEFAVGIISGYFGVKS
jgi:hypothetical protein